jgi:hypothetical protein
MDGARRTGGASGSPGSNTLPAALAAPVLLCGGVSAFCLLGLMAGGLSTFLAWDGSAPTLDALVFVLQFAISVAGLWLAASLARLHAWARPALEIQTWVGSGLQVWLLLADMSSVSRAPEGTLIDFSGLSMLLDQVFIPVVLAFAVTVSVLLRRESVRIALGLCPTSAST